MAYTLTRYLNVLFFKRVILLTLGLSGILSIFDLLANAGDITTYSDSLFQTLITYMALRFPEIVDIILPLAGLLAALSVFVQKVSNQEMIAIRSVGVSIYHLVGLVMVGGLIMVSLHFTLSNFVLPKTSHTLHLWSELDYRGAPPDRRMNDQIPNWIAAGNSIIKLEAASSDGKTLKGLSVITRSETGQMNDYFVAETARFDNNVWYLYNVEYPASLSSGITTEKIVLQLPIKPGFFAKTVENANSLSIFELWRIANDDVVFDKPAYVYNLWWHQKIAHPFSFLVMILLAAPIALKLARRDSLMLGSFYVILSGFIFFVAARLIGSLGEGGLIPPIIAAWSPSVLFIILASWLLILKEG